MTMISFNTRNISFFKIGLVLVLTMKLFLLLIYFTYTNSNGFDGSVFKKDSLNLATSNNQIITNQTASTHIPSSEFPLSPPPTYHTEDHDTFHEAVSSYIEFQLQFMHWTKRVAEHFTHSTNSGKINETEAYHFLKKQPGLKFIYNRAAVDGFSNQMRSLATSFLMGMLNGIPHLYSWRITCPLSSFTQENPVLGNLSHDEWSALKLIGFSHAQKHDSQNLTPRLLRLDGSKKTDKLVVIKKDRKNMVEKLCGFFPTCYQRFDYDTIMREIYHNILVPNNETIDFVSQTVPPDAGVLAQHLNQIHYSSNYSNIPSNSYPSVGVHFRFGDQFLYNQKPDTHFMGYKHNLETIMSCVIKTLAQEMERKNTSQGYLLVATDNKNAVLPENIETVLQKLGTVILS
eukprot:gb/GECH01007017.1/.p1 GENE.gb/GECH01007017.1/~~gb/GECH01007017.1/.p1  ORF type:complete len:401 (+),score=20.68 gb/GECH01007017.1/:1-1203(+)